METTIETDRLVEAANRLQGLPASLTQLAEIVAVDDFSLRDIVEVISYDPALTARLLRAANSASSGANNSVGTIRDAVVRLGSGPVLAIAMSGAVAHRLRRRDSGGGVGAWVHSVRAAAASDVIKGAAAVDVPGLAMTAALLHDVGKLVLAEVLSPHVLQLLAEVAQAENLTTEQAERAVLLVHHGELGAIAAQAWKLPDAITDAILHHHDPSASTGALVAVVALADRMAHDSDPAADDSPDLTDPLDLLGALGIDVADYPTLTARTAERYDVLAERFS